VKTLSTLAYWKLIMFSKPEANRAVYKLASKTTPLNIVEFGLESASRTEMLIRVVQRRCEGDAPVRYTGIDLFEGRAKEEPRLPLIEVHRKLTQTGAKIRLLPGDFVTSLPRIANQLQNVDLMVVTASQSMKDLAASWFYVPRILSEQGCVMLKCNDEGGSAFLKISRSEVESLATRNSPNRRVA
jgi:hypothetical protein